MLAANYKRGSKSAQSSIPTTVGIESAKLNINVSCQTGHIYTAEEIHTLPNFVFIHPS